MNGVHDMGGMHGMGPVRPEKNEPVFHARWEGRVFALVRATSALRKWNIDSSRHERELIPPADYLRMSYYEKWFAGLVELVVKTGLATREEIRSGKRARGSEKFTPALSPAQAVEPLRVRFKRTVPMPPRFSLGQHVMSRNMQPEGHTRLPRYARAKSGVIHRVHGGYVFPDTNAANLGENPQCLYTVRFSARELWGPEALPRDSVYLDLWESYLEPA